VRCGDACFGSNPVKLRLSKCRPLFANKRTSMALIGTSENCQADARQRSGRGSDTRVGHRN
jgi:hypothetical protein